MIEVLPTHVSRRMPSVRPEQDITGQYEQIPRPRSSRQLPPETSTTQRRQRVVESKPSRHDLPRSLPPEGGSSCTADLRIWMILRLKVWVTIIQKQALYAVLQDRSPAIHVLMAKSHKQRSPREAWAGH